MCADELRQGGGPPSIFAVVTVSDVLTRVTDEAGTWLRDELRRRGHHVSNYAVIDADRTAIRTAVQTLVHGAPVDVLITLGATGLGPRDCIPEALRSLIEKEMEGFGELFRALSYREVGASAMFSRAFAGRMARTVVFCLPGSRTAAELALAKLILPELEHLLRMMKEK